MNQFELPESASSGKKKDWRFHCAALPRVFSPLYSPPIAVSAVTLCLVFRGFRCVTSVYTQYNLVLARCVSFAGNVC